MRPSVSSDFLRSLAEVSSLRQLVFRDLTIGQESWSALNRVVSSCKELEVLDIGSSTKCVVEVPSMTVASRLFDTIASSAITKLDVSGKQFPSSITSLVAHVIEAGTVEQCYFGGNHFDSIALEALAHAIRISCVISDIDMSFAILDTEGDDFKGFFEVVKSTKFNGTVNSLSFKDTPLSEEAFRGISTALQGNHGVGSINLSGCFQQDMSSWSVSIRDCFGKMMEDSTVQILDLSRNPAIKAHHIHTLASVLSEVEGCQLRKLNLSGVDASSGMLAAVASLLGACESLESFALPDGCGQDFDGSETEKTLSWIATGLQQNHTLRSLEAGRLLRDLASPSESQLKPLLRALNESGPSSLSTVDIKASVGVHEHFSIGGELVNNALQARLAFNRIGDEIHQ